MDRRSWLGVTTSLILRTLVGQSNTVYLGESLRHRISPEYISTLANSIERVGLIEPILVARDGLVLSGYCRVLACRMLGMETIDAIMWPNRKVIKVNL